MEQITWEPPDLQGLRTLSTESKKLLMSVELTIGSITHVERTRQVLSNEIPLAATELVRSDGATAGVQEAISPIGTQFVYERYRG